MTHPIVPMRFADLAPGVPATKNPTFEWVAPETLLVDETYQRDLSRQSVNLIRKIVEGWDWARFKPPVVAQTPDGLEVIDGQHTAIAAATHPLIPTIPVMIVTAADMEARARAFVGHNKDRLTLGAVQIHYADVAAGDDDATTIQQVCERAGVVLLRYPPGNGEWKPGETLALAAIRSLVNRRHAMGARAVLQVLGDARCAPVRADEIKAVDVLLHDPEYKDQISGPDITSALIAKGPALAQEARVFAIGHNTKTWKALATILFREGRRGRRRAA